MNVTSFYASGQGITTPVMFVEYNERIYFQTQTKSHKFRRIIAHPQIEIGACDRQGNSLSDNIVGQTRILTPSHDAALVQNIQQAFFSKYGLLGPILQIIYRVPSWKRPKVFIEVR